VAVSPQATGGSGCKSVVHDLVLEVEPIDAGPVALLRVCPFKTAFPGFTGLRLEEIDTVSGPAVFLDIGPAQYVLAFDEGFQVVVGLPAQADAGAVLAISLVLAGYGLTVFHFAGAVSQAQVQAMP